MKTIPARWHGGNQTPTLVVIHATVSPTKKGGAVATANFFHTETAETSAHRVVDPGEIVKCLDDDVIAYHCGYNTGSLGLELCIYPLLGSMGNWLKPKSKRGKVKQHAKMTPLTWLRPSVRKMMRLAAGQVADWCIVHDIPVRFLGPAKLATWDQRGRPAHLGGITTHAHMSDTFHASTHWDPGAWPRARFMRMVSTAYAAKTAPKKTKQTAKKTPTKKKA